MYCSIFMASSKDDSRVANSWMYGTRKVTTSLLALEYTIKIPKKQEYSVCSRVYSYRYHLKLTLDKHHSWVGSPPIQLFEIASPPFLSPSRSRIFLLEPQNFALNSVLGIIAHVKKIEATHILTPQRMPSAAVLVATRCPLLTKN